ncbi:MAG TPA: hypothetical protein VGW76_10730 [Pyrinomonadaceae bacterium]|nr:hypothetical protein [Pyrinomonadaceae bacterium]
MRTIGLLVVAAILMILGFENANATAILADPDWNEEMPNPEGTDDFNNSAGETSAEAKRAELISAGASPLVAQDKLFASAYFDALSILATNNGCSDFFGGPAAAADIFAKLMGNVSKKPLPAMIAVHMTGLTVQITNDRTKSQYRLFDRVLINSEGAFYRNRVPRSLAPLPGVGSFQANTKEVRVLMLLHELGHAIKGDDGNWLLPDDGKNSDLSRKNSQKIEDVCGRQIKALRDQNLKHDAQQVTAHEAKND